MKNIAAARVLSRPRSTEPSWEMGARYVAAYACTLIAIAGAQLIIPTTFALFLAAITVFGLPLSLSLRNMLSQPDARYSRLTINRIFGLVTLLACFLFLRFSIPQLFTGSGSRWNIFFDTGRSIPTLMQIFLIFAVCRCLVIVSDKDTVHSALPAFCVLLLLIVVHKGPEVVGYFLAWTAVTAILFALDHRQESRYQVNGFVPAVLPGQDAVLSARSLVAVMALSLFFAMILSYVLVSRQPSERGRAENMIIEWASKLTQLSNLVPEASVNGGPERQIDFSSGPALPTRTPLWRVTVSSPDFRTNYEPQYWRMFTLAKYDGHTWSQTSGAGASVPLGPMTWRTWPLYIQDRRSQRFRDRVLSQERLAKRAAREIGYDLGAKAPGGESGMALFGTPRIPVRQYIQPLDTNSGFLPILPVPRALRLVNTPSSIRLRSDGAVDVGVLEENRRRATAVAVSELPPIVEYGAPKNGVPTRIDQKPNPGVSLTPRERAEYLQLPNMPARVKDFAVRALRGSSKDDNAYRRAQRLATAVQNAADYTLRPAPSPENRDAVDYFLFESRRGYCTYFASALTALCRTQGIPARIVSGFTNTEWTNDSFGRYGTIRESNAHAWTEVWVPNWGWATVDATPAGERGDNAPGMWENLQESAGTVMASIWNWIRSHLLFFGVALVAVILAAILFHNRGGFAALPALLRPRKRRRRGHPTSDDEIVRAAIFEIYSKTSRLMARHFRQRAPWETPHEWFTAASDALVPQSTGPLVQLADLYTLANYSLKPLQQGADDAARSAFAAIEWKQPGKES